MTRTHAAAWPTSFVAIVLLACGGPGAEGVSPSATSQEWRQLFDGKTTLVTLQQRRRFTPLRGGVRGALDRLTLHLSIGEAF